MKLSILLLISSLFSAIPFAQAQSLEDTAQCTSSYVVYSLNGINNSDINALIGRTQTIRKMLGDTYENEPIKYYVSYNPADDLWRDLLEVFEQKLLEDPTLKWQLFFRFASGKFISSSLKIALEDFFNIDGSHKLAQGIAKLSSPQAYLDPTVQKHSLTYKQSLLAGNRIMLVSHSQGNLYANAVYDNLQRSNSSGSYDLNAFGIAGVASPANFVVTGDGYVTSDTDHVIDALRLLVPAILPSNNNEVPFLTLNDLLGHGFEEIYVSKDFPNIRGQVKNVMFATLSRISTVAPSLATGPLTTTLTWDLPGDIDLHTFEPSGIQVFYGNKRGRVGYLDRDDIVGTGPEHYYAICENFIPGRYAFGINYYSGSGAKKVDMKISALGVDYPTVSTTVVIPQGPSGNSRPLMMREVEISEGQDNGVYRAVVSTNIE